MVSSCHRTAACSGQEGPAFTPLLTPLFPHHVANYFPGLFVHPDVSHLPFRVADREFIDLLSFFGLELTAVYGSFNSF
jgi:hypothetical protein